MNKPKKTRRKWLKILGFTFLGLLLLFVSVILLIRTEWAQSKITGYATEYYQDKTGTPLQIEKLYLTFSGDLMLKGLYAQDQKGDTLVYSKELQAGLSFASLIDGKIHLSTIDWNTLIARVNCSKSGVFNFDYVIDAFASASETTDTSQSTLPEISLSPINFYDFDLHYLDSSSGINARLKLGHLALSADSINLNQNHFAIDELILKNTKVSLREFSTAIVKTTNTNAESDTSKSSLPVLTWRNISLSNVQLKYQSAGDSLNSLAKIGNFASQNAFVDLGQQKITMGLMALSGANVNVKMLEPENTKSPTLAKENEDSASFTWPDWNVYLKEVFLSENNIQYDLGTGLPKPGLFDANHVLLSDFGLQLKDVTLIRQLIVANVKNISFKERSGLNLNQFQSILSFSNTGIKANYTNISTDNNNFSASLDFSYEHIDSFLIAPERNSKFDIDIRPSQLSIKDAYYFDDSLQYDSMIMQLAQQPLQLDGKISGYLHELNFDQLHLKALNQTNIKLSGKLNGLPNIEELSFNIPELSITSIAQDLNLLAPQEGISYPSSISISSNLKGNLSNTLAKISINSSDGNAVVSGNFYNIIEAPSAKANLIFSDINAAKYASDSQLGPISGNMSISASGNDLNSFIISTQMQFKKLSYKKVDYSDIILSANMKDKKAVIDLEHHKPYLDFVLSANALIDEKDSKAHLDLKVKIADLSAMQLDTGQLKMAFDLSANFTGNDEVFTTDLALSNGQMKHNGEAFVVQDLTTNLNTAPSQTQFSIASGFVSGKLNANESITALISSLETYLAQAISTNEAKTPLTTNQHLQMSANFEMHKSPLLSEMLTPALTEMDTVKLSIDFKPAEDILRLYVIAPNTVYDEMQLAQFELAVDATNIGIDSKLSFKQLNADPIEIHATEFNFSLIDSVGQTSFLIYNNLGEEVVYVGADIRSKNASYSIHLDPNHLVLNSEKWEIKPDNLIKIDSSTTFKDFILNRNKQEVSLQTETEKETLLVNFDKFDIAALTSILNAEDEPATGELSGLITVNETNNLPEITAGIQLKNLAITNVALGNLGVELKNKGYDYYDLNAQLSGDNINTQVQANYQLTDDDDLIKANIDFGRINMHLLAAFAPEYISETAGFIHGNLNIAGTVAHPLYNGTMNFVNAKLSPTMLGTSFGIDEQKFTIDNDGLYFSDFTMLDANSQKSVLNGKIGLQDPINPTFNLSFIANNFQFLNSKKSAEEDYFGKGLIDIDAKIKGDANLPKVNANLTMKSGTDITYEIPYSEAQIQEREGIVRFKNMKKPKTTFKDDKAPVADLTGIDLKTIIKVDPKTRFTIIIDPQTGDYLTVNGEANLSFNMLPNGQMDLVGKYEVNDGTYGMNLYDLVSKEFDILPGSSITWTGDPLDADMDITGEYKVQTTSIDLMANEIDLSNSATVNRYRQKLPFEVKLLIGGKILKPEIAFALDMPNDYKNTLDGTVYNKIQRLNNNESELNLQVFSLIVFNKFLPSNVAAETGNRTSELARSSVSNLLSDQLNQLSAKYIKGINLDFDLDSYTDYETGAGQQRTDLNVSLQKTLFDDRLILEVSSQVDLEGDESNSEVLGDISLEYLLTEDGDVRTKAFRKNEFQDMVEGQVMITGLSILFSKEFDSVSELKKQRKQKKKNRKKAPMGDAIKEETN